MSARRCFKCQGLGHIATSCPNHKVITLVEWETVKEEEKEPELEAELEGDEEESQDEYLAVPGEGEMLIFLGEY